MSSITKKLSTQEIKIFKVNWIRKLNATKFLQHNRLHQYANLKFSYSNKILFYRPKIIFNKDDRNFYSLTDWLVPINAIILLNTLKTEDYVIFKHVFRHDYSICPLFTCKQRCLLKVNRNILNMDDNNNNNTKISIAPYSKALTRFTIKCLKQ